MHALYRHRLMPAWVAFGLYFGLSLAIGDVFPFSQYRMYAVPNYDKGVALVFIEDGAVVPDLDRYSAFSDFDPSALQYPDGVRSSQEYLLDAVRHRVIVRTTTSPPPWEPVHLQIGYAVAESTAEGIQVLEPFVLLTEGRAWPAS